MVKNAKGALLVGKLFGPESPFIRFMWKAADLIALNLIWIICCIPVITIGPSTAAMYGVARDIAKGEWPAVIKCFFKAFKENFKQALLVSLILLVPICLIAFYLFWTVSGSLDHAVWMKMLCYLAALIIGFIWTYVFPLIAQFDNTLGNTLKNAILLPLANPFLAVLCTALNLLPVILLLVSIDVFARTGFFWLVLGGSLTAVINSRLLGQLFRRFADSDANREENQD